MEKDLEGDKMKDCQTKHGLIRPQSKICPALPLPCDRKIQNFERWTDGKADHTI